MKYQSTRNRRLQATSTEAVLKGIAPDGGLYLPTQIPYIDWKALLQEDTLTMSARILSALLPEAVRNFLARQTTRLDNAAELIAGRSPERILRLGFAVVRTGGKAVVSARDVRKGDALEIEVADGTIHGAVQRSEPK